MSLKQTSLNSLTSSADIVVVVQYADEITYPINGMQAVLVCGSARNNFLMYYNIWPVVVIKLVKL